MPSVCLVLFPKLCCSDAVVVGGFLLCLDDAESVMKVAVDYEGTWLFYDRRNQVWSSCVLRSIRILNCIQFMCENKNINMIKWA